MRLFFLLGVTLLILLSNCSTEPIDPTRALPSSSGLSLLWFAASEPVSTGFPQLDAELTRLHRTLPPKDSLDQTVPYAAFAYNLRPGELAAGLAVPTKKIRRPNQRSAGIDYRGISLKRLDSLDFLYVEYRNLSLIGREAVILQEMMDQLDASSPTQIAYPERTTTRVVQINSTELSSLLGRLATPTGKGKLAQWSREWSRARLEIDDNSLVNVRLTWPAPEQIRSDPACLTSIPNGIPQYAVLPTPAAWRQGGGNAKAGNWSTYIAPWLGDAFARLETKVGSAVALCPRDTALMQDLLDRLERDFGVTERTGYPNGTIFRIEVPEVAAQLFPATAAPVTWVLRTPHLTYLAPGSAALENILDRQLLAGSPPLVSELANVSPNPTVIIARWDPVRWRTQMSEYLPEWSAPPWTRTWRGNWLGGYENGFVHLIPQPTDTLSAPSIADNGVTSQVGVAWRWEAPAEIERILPVPGQPDCAIYLQDGTLLILDALQTERARTMLGTVPNSPVYFLPANGQHPDRWLFSTPTAVYLIDAAGDPVEGFPYRPVSGLASGIVLDDLDKKSNPAYFVPLRSGRIEAYSLRGFPLVNWTPPTDFTVSGPLLKLQSDTSTYLAAMDTLSRVKVYDWRGSVYLAFDSLPSPFISTLQGQLASGAGVGRLAALELDGRIRIMSLGGGQFPLLVTTETGIPRQFLFEQLWGDLRKDYLVGREESVALYAYAENKFERRWQARFPATVERIFTLPSLQLVGGLDRSRGLIYLLRGKDGTLVEANGLAGRIPGIELLTSEEETLLITAYRNTVYAYRLPGSG